MEDVAEIARIHVEAWKTTYRGLVSDSYLDNLSLEERVKGWTRFFNREKGNSISFLLENDSQAVGFCSAGPSRDPDATKEVGELYAIYLLPEAQKQGQGLKLMNSALDFLREREFRKATLWVLNTNQAAIDFYKATGWRADGKEKVEEKDELRLEEVRYVIDL